ncbi:MAG: ABC transporter substrate-binding protein [Chloroflexi bacterium]|nr:ABC transporter substrate-binding protein [Chloroflexota bacterium]
MRRGICLAITIPIALAIVLVACAAPSAPTPPAGAAPTKPAATTVPAGAPTLAAGPPKRGGTLNIALQNDWVTLDPLFNSAEPNGTNMIYGEWIRWSKDPKTGTWGPVPEMISEWQLGEKEVIFKLQKGIKFQDGTPWDAAAAKWNFDRMIFDPASTMKAYFGTVDTSGEDQAALNKLKETAAQTFDYSSKAVEIVDDYTVKLKLKAPLAPLLTVLSNAMQWNNPISATAYKKLGKKDYGRNPVGAGPFKFVEWKSGDHVTLERNPDYWKMGADGKPLPYLDRLYYRLIIDDSVRLLELKSGNVQFTELIQGKDVAGVKSDPNLVYLESDSSGNNYRLIFDSTNEGAPFQKYKELRQAVMYAIDREAMVKTLGFGAGIAKKYLLPKGLFTYDESQPYYWYDKPKAQSLVKDVVAKDKAITGPDGKVPVTLSVIDRQVDKIQAQMIKEMADEVGFNVTLEILERAAWTAKLVKTPGQPGGRYDFATMRNPVVPNDPDDQWRTFYYSKGGFNVIHMSDATWDKLIDQGASTYDQAARKKIYDEIQKMDYDLAWFAYLWQQNWNWAFSKKLKNFQEVPTNRWIFTETWLE